MKEPLAFRFQMRGQLLFLLLQGIAALLEPDFLLRESRLLRGDRGGLNAQGLLLALSRVPASRDRCRDPMHLKLKRPNAEQIPLPKATGRHLLAIDEGAVVGFEVS